LLASPPVARAENTIPIGAWRVYPVAGVVQLLRIERIKMRQHTIVDENNGTAEDVYVFHSAAWQQEVLIPVALAANMGLRPLLTRADAGRLLARAAAGPPPADKSWTEARAQRYLEVGKAGEPAPMMDALRELAVTQRHRPLDSDERLYWKLFLDRLSSELAIVLETDTETARAQVETAVRPGAPPR
jgi:RNA polymerase-interacting CarD/CdnL/TRCF family regulator